MPPSARLLALLMLSGFAAWTIVARVHLLPWLDRRSKRDILLVIMTPQMFRTIGALALMPGIGDPPEEWSTPLAWGDGTTAVLAMLTVLALHRNWVHATKLAWVATLFGFADLLHNALNSVLLKVAPHLGPIAYVVAFGVPMMAICHVLAIRALLRRNASSVQGAIGPT